MAVQNRGESYQKIVSGVLLLGLISSVDVFAETNAYPTNTEVSFYGEYESPANKENQMVRYHSVSQAIGSNTSSEWRIIEALNK